MSKNNFDGAAPGGLQTLIDPEIFRALYRTCKIGLMVASGSRPFRDQLNYLAQSFRQQALAQRGHESCHEEAALTALLRDTDYGGRSPRPETTEHPVERLYRLDKLGNPERSAASLIQEIWETFDRFLGARVTKLDQGGSRGSFPSVVPMGASLYRSYCRFYSPWYEFCRNKPAVVVGTRRIRPIDVVFQVVVHGRSFSRLAEAYDVRQQDIIDIVRGELLALASRMDDDDQSASTVTGGIHDGASA